MVNKEKAVAAFKQYAIEQYPKEACGVIIGEDFHPCVNIALEPTGHFQIDAKELSGLAAIHGSVEALLHSHTVDKTKTAKWPVETPSHHDMERWLKNDIPWGICSTEGENTSEMVWMNEGVIAPLEGRDFLHGVFDCYATVRDYYRLKGTLIPNFPRGVNWWMSGLDHYEQNFEKAGFVEIKRSEAKEGDAVLMKIIPGISVAHHAGVITGPNILLHHLYQRKSGYDKFNRWERFVTKYVRYVGNNNEKNSLPTRAIS